MKKHLIVWAIISALVMTFAYAADKRIKDWATTITSPAADDYIPVDGTTNGSRKILARTLAPIIAGGAATYGNATHVSAVTVDANGKISGVSAVEITATGTGNVTNNATLTAGRIVLGGGTTVIGITGATTHGQLYIGNTTNGDMALGTITGGNGIDVTNGAHSITLALSSTDSWVTSGNITGNVITGNTLTVTDFTTTNLTVSGNLTSTTVTDGQIHIGDGTNDRMVLGAITGTGITVTNGAGSIALTQKGQVREQFLTIDDLADSLNYGITYVTDAVTIVGIKGVHTGSGLSSPSIVATVKHGTDRTTGTTIEAVTVTSSTTGTADDGTLSDATVPAGSWIWVETSGKSGTTDNFELVIRYTHD